MYNINIIHTTNSTYNTNITNSTYHTYNTYNTNNTYHTTGTITYITTAIYKTLQMLFTMLYFILFPIPSNHYIKNQKKKNKQTNKKQQQQKKNMLYTDECLKPHGCSNAW